ncbi:hypothetical protein E2C01_037652 [Portunus trituberculatus]|uniref:Uncharacterized protein n=1 Tax=Portunus trituberculatus TaxID=210409 RepID=A0A5B7FFV6_PORTR|nr:hypothetical protein [Portunus trituberculatus]
MSSSGEESTGPSLGSLLGSRTSRNAHNQPESLREANHLPGHGTLGPAGVNKLSTLPRLPTSQDAVPWDVLLTALAELRDEVKKLKRDRLPPATTLSRVNEGTSTSQVSEDIDQQVAEMVKFLFIDRIRGEDYKLICEDDITKKLKNCHAQVPVDCNPEVLDALKSDAKKTDHRLQDVSKDILQAATIVIKSFLALDKVTHDRDLLKAAREVGMLNEALALLGNVNYKNNLARRFAMKRKINHKYMHLCSSKVPVTCFLFGDDVSQSTKQVED